MLYTRRETKGKRPICYFFPHAEKRETVHPSSFYTRPKMGNGEPTSFFHAPNNGKLSIYRNYTRRQTGNCRSADFPRVETREAINLPFPSTRRKTGNRQSAEITCVGNGKLSIRRFYVGTTDVRKCQQPFQNERM